MYLRVKSGTAGAVLLGLGARSVARARWRLGAMLTAGPWQERAGSATTGRATKARTSRVRAKTARGGVLDFMGYSLSEGQRAMRHQGFTLQVACTARYDSAEFAHAFAMRLYVC